MQQDQTIQRVDLRSIQKQNLETLQKNFGLSDGELNRCRFFRQDQDEPWIPSDILEAIARQAGGFETISAVYDKIRHETGQVVYSGLVVDSQGRSFSRSGIAQVAGETVGGTWYDGDALAENRALSAVLTAAGFDPFRAGSVAGIDRSKDPSEFSGQPLTDEEKQLHQIEDAGSLRRKDLKQIHKLATDKDLIFAFPSGGKNLDRYRSWLNQNFGTRTAATLSADDRASVIKALIDYDPDFMLHVPVELHEEALIA